ncbi:MAG TPA: phytanoyl-CoA dioxygenase family protein, partial [Segeticoccus sp.]|nr:phytanoyl-CoA dioxygenase family protein [Segeticoccus sp.]
MSPTDLYPTRVNNEPDVIPRQGPVVHGGPADGPLGADELGSVDQRGYVQVADLVTPDEVEAMRAELSRLSQDQEVLRDERTVVEATSNQLRSVFEVHRTNELFRRITHDPRLVDRARQALGSDVYIHQSRVNFKPGFVGKDFSWHSDFETWHAEDGMPGPRAISISVSLTENYTFNGPLMIMPGSHQEYVSCVGATPDENYKQSLVMQGAGTPAPKILTDFADRYGIDVLTGSAGGATMFDSNCMHAS